MITELAPAYCPACQGHGVLTHGSAALTCTTCAGAGMWLVTQDGKKMVYTVPELQLPQPPGSEKRQAYLRHGALALSFAMLFFSTVLLIVQGPEGFVEFFWSRGVGNALFGISGLSSIWALTHFEQHHTSVLSLHDLERNLEQSPAAVPFNLNGYANPRIAQLLKESAYTAQQLHSTQVDDAILLITLLRQPRIQMILARLELDIEKITEAVAAKVQKRGAGNVSSVSYLPVVRERIYAAIDQALIHDFPYVDLEDILLAYAEQPAEFAQLFKEHRLSQDEVYALTRWYAEDQERKRQWAFWLERGRTRPKGYMNRAWTALPTPYLDKYSVDLTQLAANGKVATVTVREAETQHILQVLGRTQKNNVLLVGEPGVGKQSLVGGIALRMIEENVPEILKDKRLVSLDLGSLLSSGGSSAEQNIQQALDEIMRAGNVILAVPEIQTIIGTSQGGLNAAALLSQALQRGAIQIISTATYADYHRYVESNPLLTSLLEVVEVKEPTPEQALTILEEEVPTIETRQRVFFTYPALSASVALATRYLPDQVLPQSALSLLDEAASLVQQNKRKWVSKDDVERVVEQKTQIPVREASNQEADLLLRMEERLHERIIGQEPAVKAVAEALRRARSGLHKGNRPISSFLFVGPTGVGKTETAKALSDLYFGSQDHFIRLDMSEYQDATAIHKLIGAPAADSNSYTEGGALTQPIREHPFSLILLDEIEKAHPDVLNLFLQLLDDGRVTENTGRTVHFNNCIIVATSNAGVKEIMALLQQGVSLQDLPGQILRILQNFFRPELLNRFDGIVPFYPLQMNEVQQVVQLMLKQVAETAAAQKYTVAFASDVVEKLAREGYDPLYGARPLRRIVQEKVEGLLARLILEKKLQPGQSLQITAEMLDNTSTL